MATEQEILDDLEQSIANTNRSNDDFLKVLKLSDTQDVSLRDGTVVPSLAKRVKQASLVGSEYNVKSENLADVPDKEVARTNLSVYSKSEVDDKVVDASTTQKGIVQLNNTLTSTSTDSALTAAQGKILNDQAFGVGQTIQDVTTSRVTGATYTNTTGKTIFVTLSIRDSGTGNIKININGVSIFDANTQSGGSELYSFAVVSGSTYSVTVNTNVLEKWVELR